MRTTTFPELGGTSGTSALLAALLLIGAPPASAMPSMSLNSTASPPGTTEPVPITVTIDTNVVSFQFDLLYATNYLSPGAPIGGSALADQQIYSNIVSPGDYRVLGFSFSNSPLTNGVLAYVPFTIAPGAPDHDESLVLSNMLLVNVQAYVVPLSVNSNATLSITIPPHFSAIFPTNGGAEHLDLIGTNGRVYAIQAATNLIQPRWTDLATNADAAGLLLFTDLAETNFPARFYRSRFDH